MEEEDYQDFISGIQELEASVADDEIIDITDAYYDPYDGILDAVIMSKKDLPMKLPGYTKLYARGQAYQDYKRLLNAPPRFNQSNGCGCNGGGGGNKKKIHQDIVR